MLTKQDLKEVKSVVKEEVENAVAQIAQATIKALENVATKDDLKEVKDEVAQLKTEVMYIKADVRDLKADSPTAKEFADHEKRISRLEKTTFPSN